MERADHFAGGKVHGNNVAIDRVGILLQLPHLGSMGAHRRYPPVDIRLELRPPWLITITPRNIVSNHAKMRKMVTGKMTPPGFPPL
jgi:hypothetical protein